MADLADHITIDVVDRPQRGALRWLAATRPSRRPLGCRGVVGLTTGELVTTMVPKPTPRRIAVLAAWDDADAYERSPLRAVGEGAREHWHVEGPLVHVSSEDTWRGWAPSADGAERPDPSEPVVVVISGELQSRYLKRFLEDNGKAVAQVHAHPGHLASIAAFSSPRNTTSISAWRSAADSRDFAFGAGAHAAAAKVDVAERRHVTNRFLRVRPASWRGTIGGTDPFAAVDRSPAAGGPLTPSP